MINTLKRINKKQKFYDLSNSIDNNNFFYDNYHLNKKEL